MTTIAFDGRYMAADGRCTTGEGMIVGTHERKIEAFTMVYGGREYEVVMGGSGSAISLKALVNWLKSGGDLMDPESEFSLFGLHPDSSTINVGLILRFKDNPQTYLLTEELVLFETEHPVAAGSGAPFARAAMACDLNAVEAVRKAIEFDCHSGGTMTCFDTETWSWTPPES